MNTDQIAAEANLVAKEFVRKASVECSLADELFLTRIIKSAIEKARPMVVLKPHVRSVTDVVESAQNVAFLISGTAHASEVRLAKFDPEHYPEDRAARASEK